MAVCKASELPIGYKRLEYVESTGQQYIDTGVIPNKYTKFNIEVAMLSRAGDNIAGVRNDSSDVVNRFGLVTFGAKSKIGSFYGDTSIQAIDYDNLRHTYELSSLGLIVDGENYSSPNDKNISSLYSITLFAWNNGRNGIAYNKTRIYSCQLYDNDVLVRYYIPCMNEEGVCGLWDKVNEVFNTSATSTQLIGV